MSQLPLRYEVEELIHAYVQCIDDDQLESWPDFFTDDCVYKVIPRENADLGLPVAVMFCDSKGMLRDRIVALRKANIYAPHFYRHLVSNVRVLGEQDGVITRADQLRGVPDPAGRRDAHLQRRQVPGQDRARERASCASRKSCASSTPTASRR